MFIIPLIIALIVLAVFAGIRVEQRRRHGSHPRCPRCHHLLAGHSSKNCPECGANLLVSGIRQPAGPMRWDRLLILVIAGVAISIAAASKLGPKATPASVGLMGTTPQDFDSIMFKVLPLTPQVPNFRIQVRAPGILMKRGGFYKGGRPSMEERLVFPNSYELLIKLMPEGDPSTANQGLESSLMIIAEKDLPDSPSGTRWFFTQDPADVMEGPFKDVPRTSDFSVPDIADVPTAAEAWFANLIEEVYTVGPDAPPGNQPNPGPAIARAMLQIVIEAGPERPVEFYQAAIRSRFPNVIDENTVIQIPYTQRLARLPGYWLVLPIVLLACGIVVILVGVPRHRHEPWAPNDTDD